MAMMTSRPDMQGLDGSPAGTPRTTAAAVGAGGAAGHLAVYCAAPPRCRSVWYRPRHDPERLASGRFRTYVPWTGRGYLGAGWFSLPQLTLRLNRLRLLPVTGSDAR